MNSPLCAKVRKRDGTVVPFDQSRITYAIFRAMKESHEGDLLKDPQRVSDHVVNALRETYGPMGVPSVEEIQNEVEKSLRTLQFHKTARFYARYRAMRASIREKSKEVRERFRKLAQESKVYFPNALAEFIYFRTYARWIDEEGRRETWIETVARYMRHMRERLGDDLSQNEYESVHRAILHMDVMPSMRLLWSAGEAVRATNAAAYNCAYIIPRRIEDFGEILYLLMCGVGVGFSVERRFVEMLPVVKRQSGVMLPPHIVGDSKEGWAHALNAGLSAWFEGKDISFDFSLVRPEGSRLKTMGGRSSGPKPLRELLAFARDLILANQERKLSPLHIYDIICKIGEVTIMGGVRRSALLSLSDLDDEEMRDAKQGQFYRTHPWRSISNNSTAYNEKPSRDAFFTEWNMLRRSGTGERGIFNRQGIQLHIPKRRRKALKGEWDTIGTNPCGEVILKSKEFCNLSEVVARPWDSEETLVEKVRIAALIGTYQSLFTFFPFLSFEWSKNCSEERLLGVSITGQWDCSALRNPKTLRRLRECAVETNKKYAKRFGISPSNAVTCVKPSGTVSLLVDSSSGMHPRHSAYYIRRVRIASHDPLFRMLRDQGFPCKPEVGESPESARTYVLEFPVKAPEGSVLRNDLSAIEHLQYWKMVKEHYTEHNPSATISVGEEEWAEVGEWVYENWDTIGGLSFLPRSKHVYELAPYEEITKEEYERLVSKIPRIDFSKIMDFELADQTSGSRELACVGNLCEHDPEEGSVPLRIIE